MKQQQQLMPDLLQNKLADALQRATDVARKHVVKSASLQRPDRELLAERGYLQEIIKGWYLLTRPMDRAGDSTAWYGARFSRVTLMKSML